MPDEGELQFAGPVDDFGALQRARELIAIYHPHLSDSQQLEVALRTTPDVKLLGNLVAQLTALAEEIDDIRGQHG